MKIGVGQHSPTLTNNFEYMRNNEITEYLISKGYFVGAYTSNNTILLQSRLVEVGK